MCNRFRLCFIKSPYIPLICNNSIPLRIRLKDSSFPKISIISRSAARSILFSSRCSYRPRCISFLPFSPHILLKWHTTHHCNLPALQITEEFLQHFQKFLRLFSSSCVYIGIIFSDLFKKSICSLISGKSQFSSLQEQQFSGNHNLLSQFFM